jgi:TolA-binding protein
VFQSLTEHGWTVVGKPRSYETDEGETNVAVRPESISEVDESTRDRWVVETADQTIDRLQAFDEEINDYGQMARDEYGERLAPYREAAIEALESLDATDADDSVNASTTEPESEATGSDPLDSDSDPTETDDSRAASNESVGTDERVEDEESGADDDAAVEESSEDTGLGEYD